MKNTKTALLAGATGLVGKQVLKQLLANENYEKVIVLLRKPLALEHPKLEQKIVDFNNLQAKDIVADHVFCCLGTTMAIAGSKEAFYKVDFTYPYEIAKLAKQNGTSVFGIITAMGSSQKSMFYYSRVKGEIEDQLKRLNFDSLLIFRPSMLLGDRGDQRLGETLGKAFMNAIDFITPKKYKGIYDTQVAQAMISYAQQAPKGTHIIENDLMLG